MAWKFWLAVAGWLSYEVVGRTYDEQHNAGIGPIIFASICTWIASHESIGLPEDDIGHKIIAFSLVLWPGCLWGMASYFLFADAQEEIECFWLLASPTVIVILGLPILGKTSVGKIAYQKWRIATALSSIGVVTGHMLSRHTVLNSPLHLSPTVRTISGLATMLLSASRIAQCHLNAAKNFRPGKRVSEDAIPLKSFPPFWGVQGPLHIAIWVIGLALCVSVVDDSQARAILVSTSLAMLIVLASIPPVSGMVGALSYADSLGLLLMLHIAPASIICCHEILVGRSSDRTV